MYGLANRRILAMALAGALLLSGCSALLDRPYVAVEPHEEQPAMGEDPSTLQVSTYSELVNAVLFLVSQGSESGILQLTDYPGDVEEDLNRACLEVAKDDPLGAYAVDFIKNSYTRVLATYEATIFITYRRSQEQVQSLVNVTGISAIREEVGQALAAFRSELALRVGYFTGDEDTIAQLVRQAYYDNPASALGMPEYQVYLYPDSGTQRIVEVLLTYPEDAQVLRQKSAALQSTAEAIATPLYRQQDSAGRLSMLFARLPHTLTPYSPQGGSTPWDALLGESADSEGLALAFQLLCDKLDIGSALVEGTLDGESHFWNQLTDDGGAHYVDLSRDATGTTFSAEDLRALGYAWEDEEAAS